MSEAPAAVIRDARVLTMLAPGESRPPERGRRGSGRGGLGELGVIERADVLIERGRVVSVTATGGSSRGGDAQRRNVPIEIDAGGRVLMPGFVDCHTHACWAGSRTDEWERKLSGATYQEIAAAGGGIMSSVRAVRGAADSELGTLLQGRLRRMVRLGSTTIEVKSGYGLTAEHELRMLRIIAEGSKVAEGTVIPTALLGHAIDPAASSPQEFVRATTEDTLVQVNKAWPGIAVDAFCEKGAWSADECARLFESAKALGHPVRVHADQFTSMGLVERAIALGAVSVDHLEASTPETLRAVAASDTFAVGLPVCGFHLDGRYARLGEIARLGGKVCIASNYNPGSAPSPGMPFAIALAARHCGLTTAEVITAATLNPARLLRLTDRGYIAPGARADLLLLAFEDERSLAYEVGANPVDTVIAGGRVLGD